LDLIGENFECKDAIKYCSGLKRMGKCNFNNIKENKLKAEKDKMLQKLLEDLTDDEMELE
jgi:hypothetical protein